MRVLTRKRRDFVFYNLFNIFMRFDLQGMLPTHTLISRIADSSLCIQTNSGNSFQQRINIEGIWGILKPLATMMFILTLIMNLAYNTVICAYSFTMRMKTTQSFIRNPIQISVRSTHSSIAPKANLTLGK